MDSRNVAEQERDIRDLLRRAERTPVKTSALRKDTLKRLIDLAHSPHSSLKIIAATNFKLFIKDFPELEDEAINAVYDLCEDPASSVRIKGYAAIVDVSREQQKWVKRNADVLVQLLQSDEPEEVTFVKRALTQHLDMDPAVTLGVICDQIVPPDEPLDDEEQAIRDRLRSLVLAFLAGEAKRSLVERHATTPGSDPEQVLVSGLFKAITKLSASDLDVIVKDILAPLPSFKPPSPRGKELLDLLLAQARAALKSDLPSGVEHGSLEDTRRYVDLAAFITIDRRLAPPSQLLRFYYTNLTPKLLLSRLSEGDQAYVLRRVAESFAACEEPGVKAPPTAPAADTARRPGGGADIVEDTALRRQFVDVCPVLLQVFSDMKSAEQRPWAACHTLLQGIARRTRDKQWQIPQQLISLLRRIEPLAASQDGRPEDKAAQVHSVIRLLLEPVKPPATQNVQANAPSPVGQDAQKGNVPSASAEGTANGAHRNRMAGAKANRGEQRRIMNVNKRKHDASNGPASDSTSGSGSPAVPGSPRGPRHGLPAPPTSLPPRPANASTFSGTGGTSQRDRHAPPHLRGRPAASPRPEASANERDNATGSSQADENASRSAKRARTDGRKGGRDDGTPESSASPNKQNADKPIPSLLSRLATGALNGKAPATPVPSPEQPQPNRGVGRKGGSDLERERGNTTPVVPAKRRAEPTIATNQSMATSGPPSSVRSRPSRLSPDPDKDPVGGYSIRGAAKAANRSSPSEGDGPKSKGPTSLLQRLQPVAEGAAGHSSDEGGGRRGRKRGRHA